MRMFCALDLPPELRDRIEVWARRQASGEGSRWRAVRPEALHLTLAFLGDRPPAAAARIAEILAALRLEGPVRGMLEPDPVPVPRRAPRLLALGVAGEEIPPLQAELAAALEREGLYEPEARPFWPHVTVLRRRGRGSRGGRVEPFGAEGDGSGHAFGAVRVALYRSETRPEGPRYTCLATRDLPQAGA